MADPSQLGPDPSTYTAAPNGGVPPLMASAPLVPSPGNAGGFLHDVKHLSLELVRAVTALDLTKDKPFVKPTPFAITYLLPHAFGGLLPNEAFGLSPDLGIMAIPQAVIVPGGADINSETQRLYLLQQQIEREENVREAAPGWETERVEEALALARGRAAGNRPQADVTVRFLENLIYQRQLANPFLGPVIAATNPPSTIEQRFPDTAQPGEIVWPPVFAGGFIDALAASLPPDP